MRFLLQSRKASRITLATAVLSAAMALSVVGPALAAGPAIVGSGESALSPTQQAILQVKLRAAAAEQARVDAMLAGAASPMTCPNVAQGGVSPMNTVCMPYYAYVTTYARQQAKSYFCGPASVQVISNYAWGIPSGSYKYTQQYISDTWTRTDANGQTTGTYEETGLNGSTSGHVPANFVYALYTVTSGSDWHNKVRTDLGTYQMPLANAVAPHDVGATHWLVSWPTAITTGHWIAINGFDTVWAGDMNDANPTVRYDDSSGTYGGSTGEFSDPARDVYYTLSKSNSYHTPNRIVW